MGITKNSILIRKDEHLLSSQVFKELVMLDTLTGDYFGLDPIASFLWEHLKDGKSLVQLCAIVQQKYNVADETFYEDVLKFIQQLADNGLIEVHS